MNHHCHWPGCDKHVPPAMWGCKPHWFALPKRLRDRVWATYRPGQEITKTPSTAYLTVAREVQGWILEKELRDLMHDSLENVGGRLFPTERGRLRLEEWLNGRGLKATVSISPENQFAIDWGRQGDEGEK